jgi:hypothetical protein
MMMVVATVVMAAMIVRVAVMRAVAAQQGRFGRGEIIGRLFATADGNQSKRSE